jgi:hypothetical protein
VTLFDFIITAYGIHPSCGHVPLQGGSYTNKIPDQGSGCPRTFLGSYPPRSKTKDQPMPQAWVPWTFPGALDISRDFNYLVPDQEPQSYTGGPLRGLYCLVPDQEPQSSTGGPLRGLYCLVPDQEPQSSTGGPLRGLIHQGTRPRINPCPRHGYPGHFQGP